MPVKTACVVGAGAAGIAALKECVRRGMKPTCYELDDDIGGTWRRKDYTKPTNTPAVWDTLITNSSKFNSCYSDFPPLPEDTPYLSAEAMYNYYKRAVKHFKLEPYIRFNTRVIKIRKTPDHEQTGKWEVYTAERGSEIAGNDTAGPRLHVASELSKCHVEVFDFVLICTGHFKIPINPDVPGLDTFKGTILHSFSYYTKKPFEGQTVLVVGNKLSAADIASDVSNVAEQVYLSVGQGTWILPRCFSNACTIDLLFPRKIIHSRNCATIINNKFIQEAQSKIDHESVGIYPGKPPLFANYCVNDDLPVKMLSGKVRAYGRLVEIKEDKAYFEDGKFITGINSIIFCTGFKRDFSFLDLEIMEESGRMEMFKMMFPLKEKHKSLAFIGNVCGDAPFAILLELQAKLATLVMAGKHQLPSWRVMKADAEFWNNNAFARRGNYKSYFLNVVHLTESVAEEIGCYPTFWKVFLRNPGLAFRNWYGPMFSAQYHLLGPDSQWDEAVLTCNTLYAERHSSIRHIDHKPQPHQNTFVESKRKFMFIITISCLTAVYFYFRKLSST